MGELKFLVEVTATGEVRDADGNLISQAPVVFEPRELTAAQLIEMGLPVSPHPDQEK